MLRSIYHSFRKENGNKEAQEQKSRSDNGTRDALDVTFDSEMQPQNLSFGGLEPRTPSISRVSTSTTESPSRADEAVERARDALELRLRAAQEALDHARAESVIAQKEYERLSKEEAQAREIYDASRTMEHMVRTSLKQYWKIAAKRKKAAIRTKAAVKMAIDESRDSFEWTLKDALAKIERARDGELVADDFLETSIKKKSPARSPGASYSVADYDVTEEDASPRYTPTRRSRPAEEDVSPPQYNRRTRRSPEQTTSYMPRSCGPEEQDDSSPSYMPTTRREDQQPHRMFGMFDARAYLERMEQEVTDIESDAESYRG